MAEHVVCEVADLPPGERIIVDVSGRSVGVLNVGGTYYALNNVCPHRGAPLCLGTVGGTMLPSDPHSYEYGRHDQIIRCPWHGWEIDLRTGRPVFDESRARVRTYDVRVVGDSVVIDI